MLDITMNRLPKKKSERVLRFPEERAKLMLNLYQLQDAAGITEDELLGILSDEVNRMIQRKLKQK